MKPHIQKHFRENDPRLYEAFKELDDSTDLTPQKEKDHFVRLCRIIVGQQLSGKAARSIYARFEDLFSKKRISANKLLKLDNEALRNVGMAYAKVRALKDLAEKTVVKEVDFTNIEKLGNEEVFDHLITVKGIGPWSIEMFLMFSLGRPDVFSYGDLGLQKGIQKVYGLKEKPSKEKVERLSKKWMPYRTYAARILWRIADTK